MSMIQSDLLLGQEGGASYVVERSLRFSSIDSAFLSRTPASAGNRKTWTWAGWVKRSGLGSLQVLFDCRPTLSDTTVFTISFLSDVLAIGQYSFYALQTTSVYRDLSAWYHIVFALDTTQATVSNRMKLYVNGSQVTTFSTTNYPAQNSDLGINQAGAHSIGTAAGSYFFPGYLADVHFIDGQALTPTSFGEFDVNNVWQPKAYTGSYGTNGFQLKFADNSAATAAALGKDTSGNGHNWTPTNLSVTAGAGNDSLVDTPTSYGTDDGLGGSVRGNYCTLNPLDMGTGITLSNGNLDISATGANLGARATFALTSQKWYYEITVSGASSGHLMALTTPSAPVTDGYPGSTSVNGWSWRNEGTIYEVSANIAVNGAWPFTTYTTGDALMLAVDVDAGKVWLGKNGVWLNSGNPSAGTNPSITYTNPLLDGPLVPVVRANSTSASCNFGQRPFAYTAPSGFKALCTANLPTPTIANPATAMDVKLYTGNSSTQTISGLGFSPDFVWIKSRGVAGREHCLFDTIRGTTKGLHSNSTVAEWTDVTTLTSFNTDGFTLAGNAYVNGTSDSYVAWAWDAGSSTVTNTSGSISSQVRASTTNGCSVVTYTGTGANATVGHGLGVAPGLVIVKRRNVASNWQVRHTSIAAANSIQLNLTDSAAAATTVWNSTAPTSTVFSIGTDATVNASGGTYVAYCFAPVAGYSAFGSYQGNGSADGPFVFLGFRPAVVIIKMSSSTGNWTILDDKREGYNVDNDPLFPNLSDAEGTTDLIDITSNGFKVRTTDATFNTNAGTYVYAAWASSPFAYARAR